MRNFRNDRGRDSNRSSFGGEREPRRTTTMFKAVCDECGKDCEVPFRPSGDKPIYCSRCFENNSAGSFNRSDNRRTSRRPDFQEKRMFEVVCDSCGKDCEVPFKPTAGKSVYCDECFGSQSKKSEVDVTELKEQLEIVNSKLDAILKKLAPASAVESKVVEKVTVSEEVEQSEPKKAKKKAVSKKPASKKSTSKKAKGE